MARFPFTRRFDLCTTALLLSHAACSIDVSGIPVHAKLVDAAAPDSLGDGELERDADVPEGAAQIVHEGCQEAAPELAPTEPSVATSADGIPEFDLFHRLDCAELTNYPRCDTLPGAAPYACVQCLSADGLRDQSAVCVPFGERACIAVAHGSGCISCVPVLAKAHACCLGLAVDCRAWPFDGGSGRGDLCARHSDCEPGLVCKELSGESRFAVCECPESEPKPVDVDACLWPRSS